MKPSDSQIPAAPLDLVSAIMDLPTQRLDFVIGFQLTDAHPSFEALQQGALSAVQEFPVSGCVLKEKNWCPVPNWQPLSLGDVESSPEELLKNRLLCDQTPPIKQIFIPENAEGTAQLIVHGNHAGADLLSVMNWVSHQLQVATGKLAANTEFQAPKAVALKTHASSVSKSRYSFLGPSQGLWTRSHKPSGERAFLPVEINADAVRELIGPEAAFTYNDTLSLAVLESFREWNTQHGANQKKISVWMPVNIRKNPFLGFGNGSSRIRIYDRFTSNMSVRDKCALIRTQLRWSKEHGEWAVPDLSRLMKLSPATISFILKKYFNRPWVDMSSGPFSHAERLSKELDSDFLPQVSKIDVFGMLDKRHPLGVFGTTFHGCTRLHIAYDPMRLTQEDAVAFTDIFENQIQLIRKGLES